MVPYRYKQFYLLRQGHLARAKNGTRIRRVPLLRRRSADRDVKALLACRQAVAHRDE